MTQVSKIVLKEKFDAIRDTWAPRRVASLNGQDVKLVKLKGDFVWHHHEHEDEMFLVVEGRLRMDLRDGHVWVNKGEALVVPRGVEHKPFAEEETAVLLFEPSGTLNTGNVQNERTRPSVPDL